MIEPFSFSIVFNVSFISRFSTVFIYIYYNYSWSNLSHFRSFLTYHLFPDSRVYFIYIITVHDPTSLVFDRFQRIVHFQILQCIFIYITITWSNLSRFRSFSIIHSRFSRVFYIYYNCLPFSFSIFPNSFPDSPVYFYIYYDNCPRSNFSRFQSFQLFIPNTQIFECILYIYIFVKKGFLFLCFFSAFLVNYYSIQFSIIAFRTI